MGDFAELAGGARGGVDGLPASAILEYLATFYSSRARGGEGELGLLRSSHDRLK